jgi:hypothetical protein
VLGNTLLSTAAAIYPNMEAISKKKKKTNFVFFQFSEKAAAVYSQPNSQEQTERNFCLHFSFAQYLS